MKESKRRDQKCSVRQQLGENIEYVVYARYQSFIKFGTGELFDFTGVQIIGKLSCFLTTLYFQLLNYNQ